MSAASLGWVAPASRGWTRPRRIVELLAVLWIIGMGDLWLTLWAHRHTEFEELNPIASHLLALDATAALVLFKLACMAIATASLWLTRHTRRCECATWAMIGVYFALLFRWSDYTADVLAH